MLYSTPTLIRNTDLIYSPHVETLKHLFIHVVFFSHQTAIQYILPDLLTYDMSLNRCPFLNNAVLVGYS